MTTFPAAFFCKAIILFASCYEQKIAELYIANLLTEVGPKIQLSGILFNDDFGVESASYYKKTQT